MSCIPVLVEDGGVVREGGRGRGEGKELVGHRGGHMEIHNPHLYWLKRPVDNIVRGGGGGLIVY